MLEQHQVFVGGDRVEGMHGGKGGVPGEHRRDLGLGVRDAGIAHALCIGHGPARKRRRMAALPPGE